MKNSFDEKILEDDKKENAKTFTNDT